MIIQYFTDNDLYKFTTMNAIQKKFPDAEVIYRFVDRGNTQYPEGFAEALREQVDSMENIKFTEEEEEFMRRKCYYFDHVFFDLLKGFRYNPQEVLIKQDGGKLEVEVKGLWYRTVLWEVPLLAMISELYFQMMQQKPLYNVGKNTQAKAIQMKELQVELSEFGTRRRFSFDVQDQVIKTLKEHMGEYMNGTSNPYFAMKYNLTPMGTHPHEWFMYHGAHYGYRVANALGMEHWVDVYDGYLGIALTDTYSSDNFFDNFSTKMAKLFDGLRWDSGDPLEFTEKALNYYQNHRIDPKSKTIVYSDSLNLDRIAAIKNHVSGRIHDVYGVGTYLTNDVGVKPLNIVIKLFEAKPKDSYCFIPTVKLSDVSGKYTGYSEEVELCLKILRSRECI